MATGVVTKLRDLPAEDMPASDFSPGTRFSLAPDGNSFVYSVRSPRSGSTLWLFEGFGKTSIWHALRRP